MKLSLRNCRPNQRLFSLSTLIYAIVIASWMLGLNIQQATEAFAQSAVDTQENPSTVKVAPARPTLPKSGVLSQTESGGPGAAQVALPWGANSAKAEQTAPLTGSVFRASPRSWTAKIFNNSSSDTYSASIKIVQKSQSGAPVKSDSYSVSLNPGESNERPITSSLNAVNATLELVSWKKTKSIGIMPENGAK